MMKSSNGGWHRGKDEDLLGGILHVNTNYNNNIVCSEEIIHQGA